MEPVPRIVPLRTVFVRLHDHIKYSIVLFFSLVNIHNIGRIYWRSGCFSQLPWIYVISVSLRLLSVFVRGSLSTKLPGSAFHPIILQGSVET